MTARTLSINLALPPGLNHSYANVAGRGRVVTEALRTWKKVASAEIARQARGMKFTGAYTVSIRASDCALPVRKDADGLPKAIIDALVQTGVTVEDSWRFMRGVEILWDNSLPAQMCRVTVEELSPAPIPRPTKAPRPKDAGRNRCSSAKAAVPRSVMKALKRRGINIGPEKIRVQ
jgi:Holliday junction resolvase RusA-like endonuclease